jgi:DNA-binding transcriptional ArsR family regulator
MPARKLRLEVSDAQGNRYTLTCEGNVDREKMLHLLDLVELMGGVNEKDGEWRRTSLAETKFEKIRAVIEQRLTYEWFSSNDALKVCEQELPDNLSLSTISTYLSRLADRGFLLRKGSSNERRYKVLTMPFGDKADIIKGSK